MAASSHPSWRLYLRSPIHTAVKARARGVRTTSITRSVVPRYAFLSLEEAEDAMANQDGVKVDARFYELHVMVLID